MNISASRVNMVTELKRIDGRSPDRDRIAEVAACLREGGLVVFPTETVYGVAANALHPGALERLRRLKQRPPDKPFTVHVGTPAELDRYVPDPPPLARRLTRKGWPGPLTVIFHVADPAQAPVIRESSGDHVDNLYHKGDIGIRCPDMAVTSMLLTAAQVPVIASSANPAGQPPPTDADQAVERLGGQVDWVVDAGPARYGRPSTVVRVEGDTYRILREGVLERRTIERLAGIRFLIVCVGNTCRSPMAEAMLRRLLADRLGCKEGQLAERGYEVLSAGVAAADGMPASPHAVETMRKRGLDLSSHRSTALTAEQVERADYVFAMTAGLVEQVAAMVPSARDRCRLLDEEDLEDPLGGDQQAYADCADRIERALQRHMQEIPL